MTPVIVQVKSTVPEFDTTNVCGSGAAAWQVGANVSAVGVTTDFDGRNASLKAQLRRATAVGARFALIAGDDEVAKGVVQVKDLAARSQEVVARADVAATLRRKLGEAS